jgi:outer membrane protein OmpA-like peptidoglycan-associated protein
MSDDAYIGTPYIRSNAARKLRLINFDTSYGPAGYELKGPHRQALDKLAAFVSQTTSFYYWVVGYASKRGNHAANKRLSANRALSVESYLASKNPSFADSDRLALFLDRGDKGYDAPVIDNSAAKGRSKFIFSSAM